MPREELKRCIIGGYGHESVGDALITCLITACWTIAAAMLSYSLKLRQALPLLRMVEAQARHRTFLRFLGQDPLLLRSKLRPGRSERPPSPHRALPRHAE